MLKAAVRSVQVQQHMQHQGGKAQDPFARLNVDIESVLLNEQNRPVQQVYAEARRRFEKPGCCLIVKFNLQGDAVHADPMLKLGINMYLRSVMEACVIATDHTGAQLVKYDDERVFLFHEHAHVALRSACKARLMARYCHEKFWSEKGVSITVTCGLEVGNLLLLVGDYYGDAVNVASKLGEDHAEAGQILISHPCHEAIAQSDDAQLLSMLHVEDGFVQISGVEIPYKSISMESATVEQRFLARSDVPEFQELLSIHETSHRRTCLCLLDESDDAVASARDKLQHQRQVVTMLQSDMSGFTRLTKKYGILHFLTLVTHCRRIFKECLPACEGRLVKYDGDNVIAKFPSPTHCLAATRAIHTAIRAYNVGKERDFQIRIKLGVSHGEVLIVGHDIVGESWEDCCTLGEDTAEVGEVLVTCAVHKYLRDCPAQETNLAFESRQVEDDHGNVLPHYNVTFSQTNPEENGLSPVMPPVTTSGKEPDSFSNRTSLSLPHKGSLPGENPSSPQTALLSTVLDSDLRR